MYWVSRLSKYVSCGPGHGKILWFLDHAMLREVGSFP